MSRVAFAVKLPEGLVRALDQVCKQYGYKKQALVEAALWEKLEDILDAYDLDVELKKPQKLHPWSHVRSKLRSFRYARI